MSHPIAIVDHGPGPQIEGNRLSVMVVFYYLHRGCDFEFIHRAMPSLTRPEFDAVVAYVSAHHDKLVEEDRLVEERIKKESKNRRRWDSVAKSMTPYHWRKELRGSKR